MHNTKLVKENRKLYEVSKPDGYSKIWKRSSLIYHCKKVYGITFKNFLVNHKGYYNGYILKQVTRPQSLF